MNSLLSTTRILLIAAITLLSSGLALRAHFGRSHINPAATDLSAPMPSLEADKAIEHLKQRGLYDSLAQAVSATRYHVSFDRGSPDSTQTYRAPNPAQGYDAYFTSDLLCIGDAKASHEWQLSMKLIGYGYGEKHLSVSPGELKAERNRVEINKSIIKEWYVNRAEGLEQGFTIAEPPAGKDESARLRLRLKVSGKLSPRLAGEGDVIEFITPEGEAVLRYGGLYAYDAEGQSLLSGMAVAGDEVWLEVDDRGADYPLTIDPTFKQQAKLTVSDDSPANDQFGGTVAISGDTAIVATWSEQTKLTASDGAVGDFFGSSVAISGETAIIGAPEDDAPTNNSGSAYVFVCSAPTEVRLSSFAATAYDQGVHLQWSTGFEVDNLGFRLYRDQAGKLSPVNPQLIAGSALLAGSSTVLSAGQTYSWWDKSVASRKDLQYWLEDVDLNGKSTWHGPFFVTPVGGHRPEIRQATLLPLIGYSQSSITTAPSRNASPQASSQLKPDQGSGLAALPAVKIAVRTEGWYRASQPEIFAAGLNPQANPQFLQLFVDGRELPISVTGEQDGRFDSGDTIEFYATGLDAPWTDTRVYWLVAGSRPGLRIAASTSGKVGKLLPASFNYTVERRDRSIYFASLRNGEKENFFGAVITTTPLDQSLTLRHLDAATTQEAIVEVSLQGVTLTPHRVRVSLNGISIGEVSFTDHVRGAVRLSVSHKLLVEGNNQVSLTALGGSNDVSLVDNIRLTYQRRFMAEANSLRFMASSDQQVTVDGFTNDRIRIVDVTDTDSVQEVRGTVSQQKDGYSVTTTISSPGQRMLLAFTSEHARRPVSITANCHQA